MIRISWHIEPLIHFAPMREEGLLHCTMVDVAQLGYEAGRCTHRDLSQQPGVFFLQFSGWDTRVRLKDMLQYIPAMIAAFYYALAPLSLSVLDALLVEFGNATAQRTFTYTNLCNYILCLQHIFFQCDDLRDLILR